MHMNILLNRSYWAILLIILGLLLLISQFLAFTLPVFRIVIAILLISHGIQLIMKARNGKKPNQTNGEMNNGVTLSDQTMDFQEVPDQKRHQVLLGSQKLKFKHGAIQENTTLFINTFLGESEVLIPSSLSYQVKASTFLGTIATPSGTVPSIGNTNFKNTEKADQPDGPFLTLITHTELGKLEVIPT